MAESQDSKTASISPELGNLGIDIDYDSIYSDSLRELKFPECLKTYDKMSISSVIASTLVAINTIASRVQFNIEPYDQSQTHKDRSLFLEQCLFYDMDETFNDVLKDFLTVNQYGFCVLEKVFRFRRKKDGSKYDDGRVGIKYLPLRSQKSIVDFKYDKNNRRLVSLMQEMSYNTSLKGGYDFRSVLKSVSNQIELPIDRILFFKSNSSSLNPYGKSPLHSAYTSWRVLEKLRDIETVSINRNLNGIPYLKCPTEVMDADETDAESILRVTKLRKGLSRISTGEQSYILLPSDRYSADEGAAAQYEFGLVSGSSSHLSAIRQAIGNYNGEVYQAMCADVLTIDDGQSASSGLTSNKQTMLNMFVEARLDEFVDEMNSSLIPDLFERNGWDTTKLPKLKRGRVEKLTVAEMAKAIQQLAATSTIPITPENTNYMMELFGFPTRVSEDMSFDDLTKIRGYGLDIQSRSGDGAKTAGEGTSKTPSGRDESAANLDKK